MSVESRGKYRVFGMSVGANIMSVTVAVNVITVLMWMFVNVAVRSQISTTYSSDDGFEIEQTQ